MARRKYILIAVLTFAINYSLDLITKHLAGIYFKNSSPLYFFYNTVMIVYTENTGAFLGMGADWPPAAKYLALIIIPMILCFYGLYYCLFKEKQTMKLILIVSIIAGGLGNLIDRLVNNFTVIDFLNFGIGPVRTGILNVADLSVTFGVVLFLIYESRLNSNKHTADPAGE